MRMYDINRLKVGCWWTQHFGEMARMPSDFGPMADECGGL